MSFWGHQGFGTGTSSPRERLLRPEERMHRRAVVESSVKLLERNHRPPHLRCLLCIRQCSAHRQPDPGNRCTCSDPAAALVVAVSGNFINRVRSQPSSYASCWSQVSCQPPHSQSWPRQLQWSRIPSSTAWSQQRVAGLWGPARSPHTARRAGRSGQT